MFLLYLEFLGPVWTRKFHHSIFVTQFPSLITHNSSLITHHSSLNFSHSFGIITLFLSLNIFHTIYGSHTCYIVRALLFCYSRNIFIPSKLCLFSFPLPLPLQPCHSPKAETQTQTHKNFSSSLAALGPSPVNNTQLFDVHSDAMSSVVTHFLAAPTSNNNNVTHFSILSRTISSDPGRCYFIPWTYSLTVFIYLICVICIWVLRKMNGNSLNSVYLFFSPLFGWWENNKRTWFFGFFFLFIWYYCAYPLPVCFNGLKCANGFYSNPFSHCLKYVGLL